MYGLYSHWNTDLNMSKEFAFTTILDGSIINDFYDGDLEYALSMFEVIIEVMPVEVDVLKNALNSSDLEECRSCLHRIKPNFKMAGNFELSEFCSRVEKSIKEEQLPFEKAKPEIESIIEEIEQTLSLLQQETLNLKAHLAS